MAHQGTATAIKQNPIRHERTLTLIGALIVFVTFVGKDAIREHYKEEGDSILSAVNRFSIIAEIERQGTGQAIALGLMYDRSGGVISKEMLEEQLSLLFDREIRYVADISALEEMVKRAPEEVLDKRLKGITQQLSELSQGRIALLQKVAAPSVSELPMAVEQLQSISSAYDRIGDDLVDIGAEVRTFATERLESAERHYRLWTQASYVLYALGWGLALYARLRGFPAWSEAND